MRLFSICLLILGLTWSSSGSEDQTSELQDSEYISVEDYNVSEDDLPELSLDDIVDAYSHDLEVELQDSEDSFKEDFPEHSLDDIEDPSSPDLDTDLEEDSDEVFEEALNAAFKTWNAEVKACDGDETCLAQVNNVLRPMVNEAADRDILSVIDPCEDRVGTYELETVDGWIIEAVLPC